MNTKELKKNFHNLIDSIKNEVLLLQFYDLMLKTEKAHEGKLWGRLTKEEQEELLLSEEESREDKNLIDHVVMERKHKKWL